MPKSACFEFNQPYHCLTEKVWLVFLFIMVAKNTQTSGENFRFIRSAFIFHSLFAIEWSEKLILPTDIFFVNKTSNSNESVAAGRAV